MTTEADGAVAGHALPDEDWGRLLGWIQGWQTCSAQALAVIDAVNGAR